MAARAWGVRLNAVVGPRPTTYPLSTRKPALFIDCAAQNQLGTATTAIHALTSSTVAAGGGGGGGGNYSSILPYMVIME